MKKCLLVSAVALLCASSAFGWTMKIKLDGNLSYEGNLPGEFTEANHIRYTSGGKQIGTGAKDGHDIFYYNASGRFVGSVTPAGSR